MSSSVWRRRLPFILWAALLLTLLVEWNHYRSAVHLSYIGPTIGEKITFFWVLAAKTAWLLTVVACVGSFFERLRRPRTGRCLWTIGALTVLLGLAADVKVQQLTGGGLSNYLVFLIDPRTWSWGGDGDGMSAVIAAYVGGSVALFVVLEGILRRLVPDEPLHGWRLRANDAVCLTAVAMIVGVVPALTACGQRTSLDRLHAAMPWNPVSAWFAEPVDDGFTRAFNAIAVDEYRRLHDELTAVRPIDEAVIRPQQPSHVIVLVLESLRHDVLDEGMMPEVSAWGRAGLRSSRHYAGGNTSHLGVFSLLYGRNALCYHEALNAGTAPQTCETLRAAGYDRTYLSSGTSTWMRMEEFVRAPYFNRVEIIERDGWPTDDQTVLRRVAELTREERPQFVFAFLMSSHFPYKYPTEYERNQPALPESEVLKSARNHRIELKNRYRNAVGYLDAIIGDFLREIDSERCLVAVTGDHGEGLFDDGMLTHWGLLSDIETRVPLVMVGPGIEPQTIHTATTHADLLPTIAHALTGKTVRIARTHGRDLLAGPQPDEALICTMRPHASSVNSQMWDALLVRGDRRLMLKVGLHPPVLQAVGEVDDAARLKPASDSDDVGNSREWATAFQAAIGRLTR